MREKLSALLDEELAEHEWDRAIDEIGRDGDLQQTWQRYHLIRAAFRNESIYHQADLAHKVARLIAEEPHPPPADTGHPPAAERRTAGARWRQPWLPSLAMAASVAAITVLGFSYWQPADQPANAELTVNTSPVAATRATKWDAVTPELENTLNGFLVEHGEFTPMSGMNGLITYAKFVSYDSSE